MLVQLVKIQSIAEILLLIDSIVIVQQLHFATLVEQAILIATKVLGLIVRLAEIALELVKRLNSTVLILDKDRLSFGKLGLIAAKSLIC